MTTYSYTGTIQSETIHQTGEYEIVAYGGAGGSSLAALSNKKNALGSYTGQGGAPGRTIGYFNFQAGEKLEIIVGGKGQSGAYAGGGGGGTFILGEAPGTSANNGLLLAAGGGGGGSGFSNYAGGGGGAGDDYFVNGRDVPGNGAGGAAGQSGTTRGGTGGTSTYKFSGGGGGAGALSGGLTGQSNSYAPGTGGASSGGYGSAGGSGAAAGGFGGGGGAAAGKYGGGGGGGGYTGGNGGPGAAGGTFFSAGLLTQAGPDTAALGNGEAIITYVGPATCFVTGTLIRTLRGDCAVEDIVVGDIAVTASGGTRPIVWIGHRDTDSRAHHDLQPVRVAAHAFGAGLPARDLMLSPGHPVLIGADADNGGGHLVPIMCLINGTTIRRVAAETVTYWHVELSEHDLLLAEGLPAESYLDWGDRPWFEEGADHALMNPDFIVPGLAGRCRPVAIDGPVVEAERRRLDAVFATQLAGPCAWPMSPGLFVDLVDAAF